MNMHADKTPKSKTQSVANNFLNQESGDTTFKHMDNRPEAIAQRKLQKLANHSSQAKEVARLRASIDARAIKQQQPVQRMAAVAVADKSDEQDFIVASSLNYAVQTAGGPLADFGANSDFSQMAPKEQLIIVHHGEKGKIGNYDATQTVGVLTQHSKGVPKNIGGITLMSCYSGVDVGGPDSSLTDQVADQLKDKGYTDIPIKGAMGPAVASTATSARAVKPSKVDEVGMEVQNSLLFKYDFVKEHKDGIATKLKTVDEILTEYTIDPGEMTIEEKISKIGEITAGFYVEFIQMASEKGYLIDQGVDGVEVTWVTH